MKHILFAYIDPGAGSLLIQGFIASILAFLFSFKKVSTWFKAKFRKDSEQK